MKKAPAYNHIILIVWAAFLILAVVASFTTRTLTINRYYNEQIEASRLTEKAFEAIKQYKIDSGIGISQYDIYNCGMIGDRFSSITTTDGSYESKKTSCNPNFAAMFIDYFRLAGVHKGEQIAIVTSGSFPALNIAAMAAAQVFELEICVMASIGSSTYGANNPDFTYFDMIEYLYHEDIIKYRVDYVSIGGAGDVGNDMDEEVKAPIIERIKASGVKYIEESNFKTNVEQRTAYIYKKCPNIKLFINIGGSLVSMGQANEAYIYNTGFVNPTVSDLKRKITDNTGLIDVFLSHNVPIAQVLNIKKLALEYGIDYDPLILPAIGTSDVYYEVSYNLIFVEIGLVMSLGVLVFYKYETYKQKKENNKKKEGDA